LGRSTVPISQIRLGGQEVERNIAEKIAGLRTQEQMINYQDKFNASAEVLAAKANNVDYSTVKSFEILQASAENPSAGSGLGAMLNAGIGLGVGLPLGQQLSQNINIQKNSENLEDPIQKLKKLKQMLDEGLITQDIFESKRSDILKDL
jgi:hypothetical protein